MDPETDTGVNEVDMYPVWDAEPPQGMCSTHTDIQRQLRLPSPPTGGPKEPHRDIGSAHARQTINFEAMRMQQCGTTVLRTLLLNFSFSQCSLQIQQCLLSKKKERCNEKQYSNTFSTKVSR